MTDILRLLIHFFFAAVTTILHNVLRNPSHSLALSDLQLMDPFLGLLELLSKEGKSEEAQRMFEFSQDLTARANEAVGLVKTRMISAGDSNDEKESVEDFIHRVECISQGCVGIELPETENLELGVDSWGAFGNEFSDIDMLQH
jgi:hypothetical protein